MNIFAMRPCLTVRDVAVTLGYSRQKVYTLIDNGVLLGGRLPGGSSIRIRPEDFEDFLTRMFAPPAHDRDENASCYLPETLRPERGAQSVARKANGASARLPDGTCDVVAVAQRVSAANRRPR